MKGFFCERCQGTKTPCSLWRFCSQVTRAPCSNSWWSALLDLLWFSFVAIVVHEWLVEWFLNEGRQFEELQCWQQKNNLHVAKPQYSNSSWKLSCVNLGLWLALTIVREWLADGFFTGSAPSHNAAKSTTSAKNADAASTIFEFLSKNHSCTQLCFRLRQA